jgi:hypothetical protein
MSNPEIKSRFYILHVEVSHGKIAFYQLNREMIDIVQVLIDMIFIFIWNVHLWYEI